jgi:hypothetical protein
MTQELIVWGLLGGFAGLVSIMAYGLLSTDRPRRPESRDAGGLPTGCPERLSTHHHPETTR